MQLTSQVKSAIGTALAAGGGHTASASERALTRANQTLASLGDATAILGMAQQENLRRFISFFLSFFFFFFFLIQSALRKILHPLSKRRSSCERQTV